VSALRLPESHRQLIVYWLPVVAAGAFTWLAFIWLGNTPPVRALAMAFVIVGITLTLRRFGAWGALTGGLALAFSPAFWSQAGGRESLPVVMLALIGTGVVAAVLIWFTKQPTVGLGIGLMLFVVLFWGLASSERSLRITTILTAWLLYLLISALMLTNPRYDEQPGRLSLPHALGILLLLTLGIINEPLFTLLAPAVVLGLSLSQPRQPWWYWILLAGVVIYGARGVTILYLDSGWWLFPAAEAQNVRIPFVIADGWREAWRWLYLINLVISQFTVFGVVLGVVGLARLARWYPTLGIVTMVAYAAYAIFGLVYFGSDSPVLLLPLFMIQIIWMTYAVYAFGQWLQKSVNPAMPVARWIAPVLFLLLPALMLLRITR
jgi:hypothetical protein